MDTVEKADQAVKLLTMRNSTLNSTFAEYATHEGADEKRQFFALKLQACLIQYEVCIDFATLLRMQPTGFARQVFLKNVVHKIVEYTDTLRRKHLDKLVTLARGRGLLTKATELQDFSVLNGGTS